MLADQPNISHQYPSDVIVAVLRPLRLPLLSSPALASPRTRLSLISRHLGQRPALEINTPFSSERQSSQEDDLPYTPFQRPPPEPNYSTKNTNMATQPEHPALLIPGPIEFDDEVLQSMGHYRLFPPTKTLAESWLTALPARAMSALHLSPHLGRL